MFALQSMGPELVKALLQGVIALAITYLAVRWALTRYKTEKTWERRLTAYADIVSALSEMRLVAGRSADDIEGMGEHGETTDAELVRRYRAARRNFEGASALAHLLLPEKTASLMVNLDRELRAIDEPDRWTAFNLEYSLLDDALHELIADGRKQLGLSK